MDRRGIEPRPQACKAHVLPLSLSAQILWRRVWDSNPRTAFKGDKHLSRMPISATHPTHHIEIHFSLCGRRRARLKMYFNMAEAVRFELTDPFGSTVFKTVAINRTLPHFLNSGLGGKNRTCASRLQDSMTTIILHPEKFGTSRRIRTSDSHVRSVVL